MKRNDYICYIYGNKYFFTIKLYGFLRFLSFFFFFLFYHLSSTSPGVVVQSSNPETTLKVKSYYDCAYYTILFSGNYHNDGHTNVSISI